MGPYRKAPKCEKEISLIAALVMFLAGKRTQEWLTVKLEVLLGDTSQPADLGKDLPETTGLVDIDTTQLLGIRLLELLAIRDREVLSGSKDESALAGEVLGWRETQS